ncbi:hypothetical protein SBADM41S_08820 [Streptomyces badius]
MVTSATVTDKGAPPPLTLSSSRRRALAPRLLLARSYYHSARLGKAEAELRRVLELDPVETYAHLMLGRTLERQGRDADAAPHLRMAAALTGDFGPGTDRS